MATSRRDERILQGALNAWPRAVSIPDGSMQQAANKLVRRRLLQKSKFGGKRTPAYRITDAGKAALKAADNLEYEREVAKAQRLLRKGMEGKAAQY